MSSSSRAAAAPESTASLRDADPFAEVCARGPTAAIAPAALRRTAERCAAVRAVEDRPDLRGVRRRVAAAQLCRVAARHAELERVDLVLAHRARRHLADEVRPARRELVDPAGAVDDERAVGVEPDERLGDRPHELGRVDAEDLRPRAGGVRERAEHVEHRTRGELAADRAPRGASRDGAPARRGSRSRARRSTARPAPAAARARSRAPRARRPSPRPTTPRGCRASRPPAPAAAATSAAAVEMLYVFAPSPPVPAVSTRSSRFGLTASDVLAHRLGAAGDLVGGLALQPQRDEEAADLRRRRLAGHDLAHHVASLVARRGRGRRAGCDERFLDHARLQEVARERRRRRGQHRLGMELDAVDRAARGAARPSPRRPPSSRSPRARPGTRVAASEW